MAILVDQRGSIPRQKGNTTAAVALWVGYWMQGRRAILLVANYNAKRWTWDMRADDVTRPMPAHLREGLRGSLMSVHDLARQPALLGDYDAVIVDDAELCRAEWHKAGRFSCDLVPWLQARKALVERFPIFLLGAD